MIRKKIRDAFLPTYGVFAKQTLNTFDLSEFDAHWNELTNIQIALFEKFGVDGYE